ncbi:amino acid ABC transporter permease [Paracoccus laeviglucosivorans]|uniref:Amino acid ABC transporter membrane protein 1, PAAT family n=1 Tax=Paracoccus laeviglucosivorans TaxID=1197861 RepID=A0A521F2W0_9RHOB|nr:amino acid ABC transporter permease [Paracoccus laeviglucosivorans]SMO90532.1 amino acid ABC transporter membrane protein 1, PAAT family [Paracoccus laeviglucosivorans]
MAYTFDFSFIGSFSAEIWSGIRLTIWLTLLTILPGFALGTACAVARMNGPRWLRWIVTGYIEGIRNTPLVIQVFWLFFGLAVLGARIGPFPAAVIALVINTGAYSAEIMRAGFQSIPKGELEAGECLALSRWQMFWSIQLPQAAERVYPALISQFILMMLATSIMSQISVEELTGVGYQIQSITFRGFDVYVVIALVYLALATGLRLLLHFVARGSFPRLRRLGTPL